MPRDKFAAMASRAESSAPSDQAPSDTPTTSAGTSQSQPPRRDKLAALAARSNAGPGSTDTSASDARAPAGTGRGNKLAAMAANASAMSSSKPPVVDAKKAEEEAKGKHLEKVKERLNKRKHILQNLDRAEDLTCQLLEIAHKTTTALQDLSCAPNISELSLAYRQTLREIHPLLSTDTEELIQPYKNHANETKQSMYAARVEMRLAKERTQVLKMFTELEADQQRQQQPMEISQQSETLKKKRPREEEVTSSAL